MQNKSRKAVLKLSTMDQGEVDDAVDLVAASPAVTLVVDMVALKQGLGQKAYSFLMAEGDLSYGSIRAATALGRLTETIVVVDGPNETADIRMWRHYGVNPVWPTYACPSLVLTSSLVMKTLWNPLTSSGAGIVLFVTGSDDYLDLMKEVQKSGRVLASILPNRGMVAGSRALSDIVLELENVLSLEDESINVGDYDYVAFVRLLAKLESHLPFVGVQYFIERQMTRLRVGSSRTRYKIFHGAKDQEIILIGSKPNIDSNAKDVSTCSLNREHPIVREALGKTNHDAPLVEDEDDEEFGH